MSDLDEIEALAARQSKAAKEAAKYVPEPEKTEDSEMPSSMGSSFMAPSIGMAQKAELPSQTKAKEETGKLPKEFEHFAKKQEDAFKIGQEFLPKEDQQPISGDGTMSLGGTLQEPVLVSTGNLGSGKFLQPDVPEGGAWAEYGNVVDPAKRKFLAQKLSQYRDPKILEEIQREVPWYKISDNPEQVDALFTHEWNKPWSERGVELAQGIASGLPHFVGETIPDLVQGGASLAIAPFKGGDATIKASRVLADASMRAAEGLYTPAHEMAEGGHYAVDRARYAMAPLEDKQKELENAKENFRKRLNAKHAEHLFNEKNPAVLARWIDRFSNAKVDWRAMANPYGSAFSPPLSDKDKADLQSPVVKQVSSDIIQQFLPSPESVAKENGITVEQGKQAIKEQSMMMADGAIQGALEGANRLAEDPKQVGFVEMVTPLNSFGVAGAALSELTGAARLGVQAARRFGKSAKEINPMESAAAAGVAAAARDRAKASMLPGPVEQGLRSMGRGIEFAGNKLEGALENIPTPVKVSGLAGGGALAGALTSDDPISGAYRGAGLGLGAYLGGKAANALKLGSAIAATPRIGADLLEAGRLATGNMGRFATAESMTAASDGTKNLIRAASLGAGGKALDWVGKNALVALKHNVNMAPLMLALGVYNQDDAQQFGSMMVEGAGWGLVHGQILGGMRGQDHVANEMKRRSDAQHAERVLLAASPEHRANVDQLNWDKVVESSASQVAAAKGEYDRLVSQTPDAPETAAALNRLKFLEDTHLKNLTATPQTRQAFHEGVKQAFGKADMLINGALSPNKNINIELLSGDQIVAKIIAANPNYNGQGVPMTPEQAAGYKDKRGMFWEAKDSEVGKAAVDPFKGTAIVNLDKVIANNRITGNALPNVIAHEAVGHGLFTMREYREKIAPVWQQLFGSEYTDANGVVRPIVPGAYSREDVAKMYFDRYVHGETPESKAANLETFCKENGTWDVATNAPDLNKILDYMRQEILADAHMGSLYADPNSPLQNAIDWAASKVSSNVLKSALQKLYAIAGPGAYEAYTAPASTKATFSPEVMRQIKAVEAAMEKYEGHFENAEKSDAMKPPMVSKADVLKSKELMHKYHRDTGKFETKPVAIVTDAAGNVISTTDIQAPDVFDGEYVYHKDDVTGATMPTKVSGYGDIPESIKDIAVPTGGKLTVERAIVYDEGTGQPIERSNQKTRQLNEERNKLLRQAIDGAGDQNDINRFRAVPGEGEDRPYKGRLLPEQRAAIEALPESVVPRSMKDKVFRIADAIANNDGSVYDMDYAARLNDRGGYQAFSPEMRRMVPVSLNLSKDGNFYVGSWSISGLNRKIDLWRQHLPSYFSLWGGDVNAFRSQFRTEFLNNLKPIHPDQFGNLGPRPGRTGLDADPAIAKQKADVFHALLGVSPESINPEVRPLPREKFTRRQNRRANQSDPDTIFRSYRLDSMASLDESPAPFKYPIPYGLTKVAFMPETADIAESEERRPLGVDPALLRGLSVLRKPAEQKDSEINGLISVPTQEELDARKANLPKYKTRLIEEGASAYIDIYAEGSDLQNPAASVELSRDKSNPEVLKVEFVGTNKEFRGKGYGEAVYREAAKYAQRIGATQLFGEPVSESAASRRRKLFETKLGPEDYDDKDYYTLASSKIPSGVRFMPEQEEDPTIVAPGFYSKAGRVLLDKMPNRASADQIKGILDPQKGSGVKPDEMKWSGIVPFIEATQAEKGFVSKDDIKRFLKDSYAAKFETQTEDNQTQYSQYKLSGGTNYEETVLRMPGVNYTSRHFSDVPNYVAHIRTQDFGNGRLIEEMQSDLHQQGREKGYERLPDTAGWRAFKSDETEATQQAPSGWTIASRDPDSIGKPKYQVYDQQSGFVGVVRAASEAEAIQKLATLRKEGVADAPFRKDWPLQLFKHALQKAVADGKEWIGWTGGEAQADRFDLRNQVDEIKASRKGEEYFISAIKDGKTISSDEYNQSQLAEVIGKGLANKIIKDHQEIEGYDPSQTKETSYSGLDLKVGGEGMKGFYDTMLPKEINKYVRQFGAEVKPSELAAGKIPIIETRWDQPNYEYTNNGWVNVETGQELPRESPDSLALSAYMGILNESQLPEEAKQILRSGDIIGWADKTHKIWKINITPEMRSSVEGGQPRFMPETLDAEHAAAYEAGDEEKGQRLVDEAAKRAGWNVVPLFHGSGAAFNEFKRQFLGTATGGKSANNAFFFTDSPKTARNYAIYAAEEGPIKELLRKADAAEKRGDWDAYEDFVTQAEDASYGNLGAEATAERRKNAKIYNVYLNGKFMDLDAEGKTAAELSSAKDFTEFDGSLTSAIQKARRQGYDGVVFRRLDDAPSLSDASDHYAILNPNSIKLSSPFTYDNSGKLIPLSERFNPATGDIRFMPETSEDDDAVRLANSTARAAGAVGAKAITPRYVASTTKEGDSVLNFGAGKPDKNTGKYLHSEMVRGAGGNVEEYDFGGNSTGSLGKQYDTVFASNVLNVQSSDSMLDSTLNQIWNSVSDGGRAVFNYPESPRYIEMSPKEVAGAIKNVTGIDPVKVGGTNSAPLWEVKKPQATTEGALSGVRFMPDGNPKESGDFAEKKEYERILNSRQSREGEVSKAGSSQNKQGSRAPSENLGSVFERSVRGKDSESEQVRGETESRRASEAAKRAQDTRLVDAARQHGVLLDHRDFLERWRASGYKSGAEHQVILGNKNGKVEKRTNIPMFEENWGDYFDRIRLHNEFFPETKITVKGIHDQAKESKANVQGNFSDLVTGRVTGSDPGAYVVTEQPYVKILDPLSINQIDSYLNQKNFFRIVRGNLFEFYNPEAKTFLRDAHEGNVVSGLGPDGKEAIFVIDVPMRYANASDANDIKAFNRKLFTKMENGSISREKYDEIKPFLTDPSASRALEGAQVRFMLEQDDQEPVKARMPMSAVEVLHKDSSILPKPEKKQSNSQIAMQLADVAERYHGQKITSSNITPEIETELVSNGADEAEAALKASGKNAGNWYSTAIQAALKVAAILHKVLTDVNSAKENQFFAKESDPLEAANFVLRLPLAITSQNMTVPLNARFAEEQFNIFQETGKFDPSKKYGGKAKSISANLNLANEMIGRLGGILELQKFVKQEFTVRELETAISKAMGKKIGIAGRKDDIVNGAAIFGPKIGQGFLQNLMGKFDPVTIDLWMRRTWGRWTGDVVGDGVTGVRLGRMIQAFRDAGKQLPESIKLLKTVVRSTGLTETGRPKKPELTVTENVEDRIESDLDFRKDLERIAKETDAEFQKQYALMSAPMSPKLAGEIRAAMPVDPASPTQSELQSLDKAYRKTVKVQSEIAKLMNDKFSSLTMAEKKALNPEDAKTAIKKDVWIAMEHAKQGRTEKLENPEKNLLKPEWAKAAKVIVSELNPVDVPSDQDRMVISRVVNKIRETLERRGYTVTNADVQAILWYPEKDLWAKLAGKKESNLKQSYDDEFIKIAEQRGLGEEARRVARDVRGY